MAEPLSPHALLGPLEKAIYATLAYSSLSDYPLEAGEIHHSLFGYRTYLDAVKDALRPGETLRRWVGEEEGRFYLVGQERVVSLRRAREKVSEAFLGEHGSLLAGLCNLPYVRGVAISGALAFRNLKKEREDLDLFVITESQRLWLGVSATWLWRKTRGGPLCINYLVGEEALSLPHRNAYNAHQLIHLRPVAGGEVFDRLWEANAWVKDFFPNFTPEGTRMVAGNWTPRAGGGPGVALRRLREVASSPLLDRMEARINSELFRQWTQRKGRGAGTEGSQAEQYSESAFKRHPNDHRVPLMEKLKDLLRQAGWPEGELPGTE